MSANRNEHNIEILLKENAYLRDRVAKLKSRERSMIDLVTEIWRTQPEGSDLKKQLEPIVIDCVKYGG